MNTKQIITLARKHCAEAHMETSARLCLSDAISLYDKGDYTSAKNRALKSLQYSVGVFHSDYIRASTSKKPYLCALCDGVPCHKDCEDCNK